MEDENEIGSSKGNWKDPARVKTFLDTAVSELARVGRSGGSLRTESWTKIREELQKVHSYVQSQKQCKNFFDHLKTKYFEWVKITQKSGNFYNWADNTITFTAKEWTEYIKIHPRARCLRASPLLFPELCTTLFEGSCATGSQAYGPSARTDRDTISVNEVNEDGGDEDIIQEPVNAADEDVTKGGNDDATRGGNASKKRKSSQIVLEEKICAALDTIVKSNNEGPSVQDCITELNAFGWPQGSSLYVAACGIICESAAYRTSWMLLDKSDIHAVVGWVMGIGRQKGYTFEN